MFILDGKIPKSAVIDQTIIDHHDLCYQCSKDGPSFCLVT